MFMYSVLYRKNKKSLYYGQEVNFTHGLVYEGGASQEEAIAKVKACFGQDIEIVKIYKTGDYERELKELQRG